MLGFVALGQMPLGRPPGPFELPAISYTLTGQNVSFIVKMPAETGVFNFDGLLHYSRFAGRSLSAANIHGKAMLAANLGDQTIDDLTIRIDTNDFRIDQAAAKPTTARSISGRGIRGRSTGW